MSTPSDEQSEASESTSEEASALKRPGFFRRARRFVRRWTLRFAFVLVLVVTLFELHRWYHTELALMALQYEVDLIDAEFFRDEEPLDALQRLTDGNREENENAFRDYGEVMKRYQESVFPARDTPPGAFAIELHALRGLSWRVYLQGSHDRSEDSRNPHAKNRSQLLLELRDNLEVDETIIDTAEAPDGEWPELTPDMLETARLTLERTEWFAQGIEKAAHADLLAPKLNAESFLEFEEGEESDLFFPDAFTISLAEESLAGRLALHEFLDDHDAWQRELLAWLRVSRARSYPASYSVYSWVPGEAPLTIAERGIAQGMFDAEGLRELSELAPVAVANYRWSYEVMLATLAAQRKSIRDDWEFSPLEYLHSPTHFFKTRSIRKPDLEELADKHFWISFWHSPDLPRAISYNLRMAANNARTLDRMLADPDWFPKLYGEEDRMNVASPAEGILHPQSYSRQLLNKARLLDHRTERLAIAADLMLRIDAANESSEELALPEGFDERLARLNLVFERLQPNSPMALRFEENDLLREALISQDEVYRKKYQSEQAAMSDHPIDLDQYRFDEYEDFLDDHATLTLSQPRKDAESAAETPGTESE